MKRKEERRAGKMIENREANCFFLIVLVQRFPSAMNLYFNVHIKNQTIVNLIGKIINILKS